jgi:queuosine precursor transporter
MLNLMLFLSSCGLLTFFAWFFRYLGQSALTAWIAVLSLIANLFVLKQISLFGFNATASDIFAIGSLLGLNLLQEKFGRQAAQQAIWASFSCLFFFAIMSYIHLCYEPSQYDQTQHAYLFLLSPTPRIILASLTTFFIVQQFDSYAYHVLRKRFPYLPMIVSSAITLSISQSLDTLLFGFLGLYGLVGALVEIMIVSYCIKLLAIANTLPWSFLSKQFFVKT